ncbi:response regulator [Pseudomonas knackmussii]|uniref:response regulator n=1 Tax=Pseudomonas knackmussii TaxID=65741 RepID=UPI003BEA3A53
MRLLLAEDDAMIGEALQQGLRKEGYSVDWVQDGKSALLALETTEYALLLLDLGLPRSDGMEVLRRIRRGETALPVIIITARDTLPDRVAGLDCGADDYLVKPFAMEELLARMRAVSRRQVGRVQVELSVGPLRMDPAGHLLWLRGEPVSVSAKEFALLHVLMQGPERILSREQLEDRLYGWGEEIGSNAVQVHIFNLRKKLGADVIRSVRGVGYHVGEDQ